MTASELLESCASRLEACRQQVARALSDATPEAIARPTGPSGWDVSQILRHLVESNASYLGPLERLAEAGRPASEPAEARRTWLGRQIEHHAGPQGNAAVPGRFRPGPPEPPGLAAAELDRQLAALAELGRRMAGLDIEPMRMRNPVVPLFRMTVCDAFAILAAHTERHAGQVSEGLAQ